METFLACFEGATVYLELGIRHILDPMGADHILFVVALCAAYAYKDLRKLAWLVTAFTVGHSLTLVLAAFDLVRVDQTLTELLIAVSILITAVLHLIRSWRQAPAAHRLDYGLALGFGLIHGLGFSGYFRTLLGQESCITGPLLFFNIGLEAGQLLIVSLLMALNWFWTQVLRQPMRPWTLGISSLVALYAIYLIVSRIAAFG
jgi:hydrogenase/urease accessory protein HupE